MIAAVTAIAGGAGALVAGPTDLYLIAVNFVCHVAYDPSKKGGRSIASDVVALVLFDALNNYLSIHQAFGLRSI